MPKQPARDCSDQLFAAQVLVGDSVREPAQVTIRGGKVYVEFDAPDLDSISFALPGMEPIEQGDGNA